MLLEHQVRRGAMEEVGARAANLIPAQGKNTVNKIPAQGKNGTVNRILVAGHNKENDGTVL